MVIYILKMIGTTSVEESSEEVLYPSISVCFKRKQSTHSLTKQNLSGRSKRQRSAQIGTDSTDGTYVKTDGTDEFNLAQMGHKGHS